MAVVIPSYFGAIKKKHFICLNKPASVLFQFIRMVYLDNSATSYPKPKSVYHMYKNAIKYYYSNPGRGGYENALLCAEKIYETRKKIADFLWILLRIRG